MTPQEIFAIWAPPSSVWSAWAAPALFAQLECGGRIAAGLPSLPDATFLADHDSATAVVVDLPGAVSIAMGLALAQRGWRPVPLFNVSPGPAITTLFEAALPGPDSVAIDMAPVVNAVCAATDTLQRLALPPASPPAFLLDACRLTGQRPLHPHMFDNRWMVFPQDFPSAGFLVSQGIARVCLVQQDRGDPQDDLAHVLRRWQEKGIEVLAKRLSDAQPPAAITVERPSRFKASWYRALAMLGFRRNSAGGFGSYIPETTGAG